MLQRYFSSFRASARGLEAQRIALSTTAENIANARTTRTEGGGAYQLKRAVHTIEDDEYKLFGMMLEAEMPLDQAHGEHFGDVSLRNRIDQMQLGPITEVTQENKLRYEYDPTHPHADENGMVAYPDINVVEEMARMVSANRIYEANLTAVQAAKEMIKRTIDI